MVFSPIRGRDEWLRWPSWVIRVWSVYVAEWWRRGDMKRDGKIKGVRTIPPFRIRCPQPQFGMRHLVNADEVEAGTVKFAGNTVWSVRERFWGGVPRRGAISSVGLLTFTFTFTLNWLQTKLSSTTRGRWYYFRSTLTVAKCCWSNITVHYFCRFRCVISPL